MDVWVGVGPIEERAPAVPLVHYGAAYYLLPFQGQHAESGYPLREVSKPLVEIFKHPRRVTSGTWRRAPESAVRVGNFKSRKVAKSFPPSSISFPPPSSSRTQS